MTVRRILSQAHVGFSGEICDMGLFIEEREPIVTATRTCRSLPTSRPSNRQEQQDPRLARRLDRIARLTLTVKATDLASLHCIHRAALGYRMCRQIMGAEGTLFMIRENSLLACTMATRNRMIIHARIPCTNRGKNDGDLFAVEAPPGFDRVLRRFGDKLLALTGDGSRLEIILPRPKNARGMISLPMERVNGCMLSVTYQEPATTVCMSVEIFIAAMKRVPRGKPWDLLAIRPSDAGLDLRYVVNDATMHEQLSATMIERSDPTTPFVCSKKCVAGYVRVLKCLPTHGLNVKLQISASRIAIWTDAVTVQFFADRSPSEWIGPSNVDMNTDAHEIKLFLDRPTADLPKNVGQWLRRLVRNALADGEKIETTWILSRDLVVVELDCGLQTSVEIPCTFESWPLEDNEIFLTVCPLTTAALLECCEKGTDGCRLVYQDTLLTFQSSSPRYELSAHGTLNKSIEGASSRNMRNKKIFPLSSGNQSNLSTRGKKDE